MDRSNTLMTPQELERMPDQGLEFEQSVGPKEVPKASSPPIPAAEDSDDAEGNDSATAGNSGIPEFSVIPKSPIVLSHDGDQLTTITVLTSQGEKVLYSQSPSSRVLKQYYIYIYFKHVRIYISKVSFISYFH